MTLGVRKDCQGSKPRWSELETGLPAGSSGGRRLTRELVPLASSETPGA